MKHCQGWAIDKDKNEEHYRLYTHIQLGSTGCIYNVSKQEMCREAVLFESCDSI